MRFDGHALLVCSVLLVATCDSAPGSRQLTVESCLTAGGSPVGVAGTMGLRLGDPPGDLSRDDPCPGGRTRLGKIEAPSDANGGLCCEVPPSLDFADCRAIGGQTILDPGDGSSYRDGCPGGQLLAGWLTSCDQPGLCGEGGICCRPRDTRRA